MCHTWLRQNSTPKCLLMTSRTRNEVHRLFCQPWASGPCLSSSASPFSCSSVSRRGLPGGLFTINSSPAQAILHHLRIEAVDTPNTRAITLLDSPVGADRPFAADKTRALGLRQALSAPSGQMSWL